MNANAYLFNVERNKKDNDVLYTLLEKCADGTFIHGKYEGNKSIRSNSTHPIIIVCSNYEPAWDKLSLDRWEAYKI